MYIDAAKLIQILCITKKISDQFEYKWTNKKTICYFTLRLVYNIIVVIPFLRSLSIYNGLSINKINGLLIYFLPDWAEVSI
ncbi:MAG: hypothetical protein BHV68_22545 [Bacteroidales bacterium 43_8]|nr:MAG: hypothetical protein BHV68_22545 [Bacteroidales bacterium 43_8]